MASVGRTWVVRREFESHAHLGNDSLSNVDPHVKNLINRSSWAPAIVKNCGLLWANVENTPAVTLV